MKKHLVIIGIILMLLTIGLSGCTENTGNNTEHAGDNDELSKFVGTWEGNGITITFFSNGTYTSTILFYDGTYEITDGSLALDNGEETWAFSYIFFDDQYGNTLLLTDDEGFSYTLKKQVI